MQPARRRRRPRQGRARFSSQALQDALVRLLGEQDYSSITIRELVGVAGAGVGTFYDYYSNKDELARSCVYTRTKMLQTAMQLAANNHNGEAYSDLVHSIVTAQVECHRKQPRAWAAHYTLERVLSGTPAYRIMADRYMKIWEIALMSSCNVRPRIAPAVADMARTCQVILYGMLSYACLSGKGVIHWDEVASNTEMAITAYISAKVTNGHYPHLPADQAKGSAGSQSFTR